MYVCHYLSSRPGYFVARPVLSVVIQGVGLIEMGDSGFEVHNGMCF